METLIFFVPKARRSHAVFRQTKSSRRQRLVATSFVFFMPIANNTMAIMAIMSDGRVDKNELCLQFCLVYFLSLSDMRSHCQSQIKLLAFFDSRNTPTTFSASRWGLFLSPVNLLRLLLYSVRETRNCCIIETTITNTVDINNTNDVAFDVMMI